MVMKIFDMKRVFWSGFLAIAIWACTSSRESARSDNALLLTGYDSTQYELIIIDPGFDTWYLKVFTPAEDRSDEYYHHKNLMAVPVWNHYFMTGQHRNVIENYLNYQPGIDYGIELNRRLYWYFMYIQETSRIKLL